MSLSERVINCLPRVGWLWPVKVCLLLLCTNVISAQPQDYPLRSAYDNIEVYTERDTAAILDMIRKGNARLYEQPDSAILLFKRAADWSKANGYYSGIPKALINIASCYVVKGDYQKAIRIYKKALPYCIFFGDEQLRDLTSFCINISVPYYHLNKNDSALAYLLKGLDIAVKVGDTQQAMHLYANIAGLWTQNEMYDRSVPYAEKGIALALRHNDSARLAHLYGIMATNSTTDRSKSLYYLNKAFQLANSTQQKKDLLSKAGATYLHHGIPDSAVYYLERRLALVGAGEHFREFDVYSNLGVSYHLLKRNKKALHYMKQALAVAEATGKRNLNLATTWYNLADILISMGRYKEATQYLLPYADLRDSLLNAQRNEAFDMLDVKYRTAEKDKKIVMQELQLAREQRKAVRQNLWVGGIITGLVFIIAFGFIFYRSKQRNQQNELLLLQQQKEMSLLKAGMKGEEKERTRIAYELHDGIGGMLAAIKMNFGAVQERYQALYGLEELTPIMHMVEDTTDELRKTVQNLIPGVLLKHSLGEALRIYCSNINATGKLKISLQLYGSLHHLSKDFELMLYRIVQELIQNIIKHAQATQAVVELEHNDGRFSIFVEDNGIGFDTTVPRKGGFGLENLRYRVQALQGYIAVESAKDRGTTVNITFDDEKVKTAFV